MRYYRLLFFLLLFPVCIFAGSEKFYVNHKYKIHSFAFSPDSEITAIVYPNQKVTVLYYEEDFSQEKDITEAKIKTDDGREGFIPVEYLQKKNPNVPKSKIVYERFVPKDYYITVNVLNMRLKPSLNSEVITGLSRDEVVRILKYSDIDDTIAGNTSKWAYVSSSKNQTGWVFSYYLSPSKNKEVEEHPDTFSLKVNEEKFIKLDKVYLYQLPIALSQKKGTLLKDKKVKILKVNPRYETLDGIKSTWVLVESSKNRGWIFGGYLKDKIKEEKKPTGFGLPLRNGHFRISSKYGPRYLFKKKKFHTGLDLYGFEREKTFIYASDDGEVIISKRVGNYGNLTVIQHKNGLVTYYAHQSIMFVKKGAKVERGESIGKVGSTGKSTGPHLHFEVREGFGKKHFNPETFISIP